MSDHIPGFQGPLRGEDIRRAIHEIDPPSRTVWGASAMWVRFNARRSQEQSESLAERPDCTHGLLRTLPGVQLPFPRHRRWVVASIGAGVAAILAIAVGIPGWNARQHTTSQAPFEGRTYSTDAGQRATILLADGSRVTLAPATSITLDAKFGDRTRRVALRGEAFFEVTPNDNAPFVVRTGSIHTRVLGTEFNVRRYEEDLATRIAVASGKVVVNAPGARTTHSAQGMVLTGGMVGHANDSTVTSTMVGNVRDYTEWKDGRLVFRDTPIPEVIATLGRWYNLQFRLTDTILAQQHLSATFEYGPPEHMLAALRTLLGVSMRIDGRIVTLVPKGRAEVPLRRDLNNSLMVLPKGVGR